MTTAIGKRGICCNVMVNVLDKEKIETVSILFFYMDKKGKGKVDYETVI